MFLDALTARDRARIEASLTPDVRMRALLPSGHREYTGPGAITAAFLSWFGEAEEFEVVATSVTEVAGRLSLSWRFRVQPAPFEDGEGWHIIEQYAVMDGSERIESIDLLCTGFEADRSPT